jgi:hypothetical protein
LRYIKERGIKEFIRRQKKRIGLLETMIEDYDDGRSRSFFCRAAALLDPKALKRSLNEARKATRAAGGGASDAVNKAKVLRGILAQAALSEGIEMTAKR